MLPPSDDGGSVDLPTLIDVLAEFGVTGSPAVVRFAPIAAAVQQQRLDSGASGTSRTTRSTALWTLLNLDPDLADVLGRAGLSAKALGELLSVSTLPTAEFTGPAILHDDFAEGLRSYLRRHKSSGPFTPTDLAASILQSASNLDVGLLPSRLSQLSVDPADLLDRLGSTAGGESRPRLDAVRVAEVDPFDFGVTTGADGPRGRRLNPYLERPTDKDVEHHLRDDHAVLVQATRGSGAPRSVYEIINRVAPDALLVIAPRPGEFDPNDLPDSSSPLPYVLWIEDLNAQWGVLGPKLAGPLREWLGQPTRYFVAVAYSEGPDALGSREFQALRLPVVVVDDSLSARRLTSMSREGAANPTGRAKAVPERPGRRASAAGQAAEIHPTVNDLARHVAGLVRSKTAVTAADILLGGLRWAQSEAGRNSASGALVRSLPDPVGGRIDAAVSWLIGRPDDAAPIDPSARISRAILDQGSTLALRVNAPQVLPHHLLAGSLVAPLPRDLLATLTVSQDDLRSALRRGIAENWPNEDPAAWDDILGSRDDARPSFDPPATRLMRWADAVRRGAGRPEGTALDVILGAVAGARAALETGEPPGLDIEVESMLQAQPSPDRPLDQVIDQTLAVARVQVPDPPQDVDRQSFAGVLSAASAIARRTTARAVIGPRHLLAAALTTTAIPSGVATALGGGSAELRERLHTAIVEHHHDDDLPAWDAIFDPGELVNDYRSDHVAVRRPWLDRSTRTPLEDDFDLENYVSMMAGMIARRTTAMPVSIGLFGEWGSGKSYFMELVKQRVDQLRTDPAGTATYCSQIVQISFNAWNYADTNLWASLASEFFTQLGAKETDPDDDRRAQIRRSLRENNQIRTELDTLKEAAAARSEELRESYAETVLVREERSRKLDRTLIDAVLADEAIDADLKRLAKQIGMAPGADGSIGQDAVRATLQFSREVQGIGDDLVATRRILARRSLRWPFALLLLATALVMSVLLLPQEWWSGWTAGGAITGVVAFMSSVGIVLDSSRRLVGRLRTVAERAQTIRDEQIRSDPQVIKLATELHRSNAEVVAYQARLQELDTTIAQLDRQLIELEPGRRLYEFIADRAASLEYRSQLGVVSLVRRDFERLVELMEKWRREPKETKNGTPAPIERIVLYIDDLDRCEPHQVVQVLQAVHLLLAMDLFVVVVGVDPRWLLRALSNSYRGILTDAAADSGRTGRAFAASTPQNYLEKIFQVPFALPALNRRGFEKLLRSLATATAADTPTPDRENPPDDSGTAVIPTPGRPADDPATTTVADQVPELPTDRPTSDSPDRPAAPARPGPTSGLASPPAGVDAVAGSTLARLTTTPITGRELTLLGAMAPLVKTARSAKRLFNIYGLLRSYRNVAEGRRFLGSADSPGDYQAVVQLLGILSGAPELLEPLLWGEGRVDGVESVGLGLSKGPGRWSDFVDSLEPVGSSSCWGNAVTVSMDAAQVGLWRRTVGHLQSVRPLIKLDDIERYRLWAGEVARFSFVVPSADPTSTAEPQPPTAAGAASRRY